jgi:hypothetical protein
MRFLFGSRRVCHRWLGSGLGHNGPILDAAKELANPLPDLGPAREPAPVSTNQAHEFIALVDGKLVILWRTISAGVAQAVHQ